ncbi:zinc dependent phospholipase C family protein [Paenibacillus sp. 481]|uniref:zinc dependent phospholipase C family protein n=1 Tax=Paenibacillus sp. 481 TaxID=2835869 RepID=UPI001E4BDCFA|nr:zinc dependent phospholipase C family protein [Paenibacillus sp. 481]UHA74550.1 zinc dependent phospholipase C family protein [Paenibacillus sp. 481]
MPNIWTHLLFGQEALTTSGLAHWLNTPAHKQLFNMGCQGPDFLFYHKFFPWQRNKTMNRLGSEMHAKHCGPVLIDLLDAAQYRKRETCVYMLGFVLHHILDRHMHPYVFVRSGFRKWDHQRFEILMDTQIVQRKLGLETWQTPVWTEIDTNGTFPEEVVDAFEKVTHKYYPELAYDVERKYWNEANRDMIRAQKLFHDPRGIKRVLTFGQIEPMMYKREVPPYDVLNETHRAWPDPTGTGDTYTTSIWDMWEEAAKDAARVLSATLHYWETRHAWEHGTTDHIVTRVDVDESLAQLRAAVGNRSYETGLPVEYNRPIRVEDPIWL